MKTILIGLFVLTVFPSLVFAENFKWEDAEGKKHYSDNIQNVPLQKIQEARYKFESLPPVIVHVPKDIPVFREAALHGQMVTPRININEKLDPGEIRAYEDGIKFFENDLGKYDEMINKWPDSIAKWRLMRKVVLETTASKENVLSTLARLNDSAVLKMVKVYLKDSIENDKITSKWNNFGNASRDTEIELIPGTSNFKVIDDGKRLHIHYKNPEIQKKNGKFFVKTYKPTADRMIDKLSRRLRAEEAQKKLILIALKAELKILREL